MDMIFGNVEKFYDYLKSLQHELMRRNPSSYVCLKPSIDGFRRFLSLNGCRLRSKYLGTIMSATALDNKRDSFWLLLQLRKINHGIFGGGLLRTRSRLCHAMHLRIKL